MFALVLIGLLLFLFSLIYLIYHFIKKISNKERTLSKKIFYPSLIGGLLLFIIGASFLDTGLQEQLDKALAKNSKLTEENKEIKSEISKLQLKNAELIKENKNINIELKEVSSKVAAAKESEQTLKDQQTTFQKEKEELNQQITDLESKNNDLNNEIDSLNSQLASASSSTSTSSSSSSSSSSDNNTTVSSSSSAGTEVFQNCTDLRGTYPNGVPAGHPAYVPSMDRDKDNYACER